MSRIKLRLTILATSILAGIPLFAADKCDTLDLEIQPKWISTAELNPSSGEILISDPKGRSVLAYKVSTQKMSTVKLDSEIPPASITKVQGGFLIKYRDDAVILGSDKKLLASVNLRNTKAGGATGLGSLYSNWVTKDATFIGYGSIVRSDLTAQEYQPSRGFQLGFLRGTVTAASGQFRNIELLEATEDNDYYVFGFPYFAATENGLFYVRMVSGGEASIVRVRDNATGSAALEPLSTFPEKFRVIPKLKTKNEGPASAAPRFAEIEKSTIPVGLFGQGKYLYLLARHSDGAETQWSLFQIDPSSTSQKPVELRLPTKAHHLSVVPGPDSWYFFERGEVKAWGDQEIRTVVQIPRAWIEEPLSSPLLAASPRVQACPKAQ